MADFKTESLKKPLQDLVEISKKVVNEAQNLNKEFTKTATLIEKASTVLDTTSAKGLKNFNEQLSFTNKLVKEKISNDKVLLKAQNDLAKTQKDLSAELVREEKINQQKIKTQQLLSAGDRKAAIDNEKNAIQRIAKSKQEETLAQQKIRTANLLIAQKKRETAEIEKATKKKALENKKLLESTSFYKKLTTATNKASMEFKELASQFGVNSKQAQKALTKFKQLDDSLRKVTTAARDGRRDVGRYGIALKGIGTNLVGALGVVGGVQLFAQGLRETFNIVKNFSSAQSELAGILGKNKDEITDLTDVILDLGSSTSFTAEQVTEASTSLARLGFGTEKIKESLKGVLDGAVAFGVSIEESADLTAKSLNSFQLSANESDRVVSALAISTTKSATSFAFLNDSLPFAATGARLLGQTIEETTAQIGVLADNNVKASIAGTSLRKIFSVLNQEGLTLDESLAKINNSTNKSKTAFDLFGATAQDSAVILAENINKTDELTKSITNQQDALQSLVATRLDNLSGDIDKFSSAWEGLVLSIEKGDGALAGFVRILVQATTGFLSFIGGSNKVSDSLIKQKTQINLLVTAITDENISQESRLRLLNKLKVTYPEYLKNVNIDKVSNEKLRDVLKQVNEELVKKIRLQINQEKVLEAQERLIELIRTEDELRVRIAKEESIGKRTRQLFAMKRRLEDNLSLQKQELKVINDLTLARGDDSDSGSSGGESNEIKSITTQTKKERELTGAIEKQSLVVNQLNEDKKRAKEQDISGLTVQIEEANKELKRLQDLGKVEKEKEVEEEKTVRDDSEFELDKFRLERDLELYDDYTEERKQKEIEFILFKRDYALEQADLTADEITLIEEKANQEILDLDKKFQDERLANLKEKENELQDFLKDAYAKTFDFLEGLYDKLNQQKIRGVQDELDANIKNQDRILAGIDAGSKIGEESLAQERKAQEEQKAELIRLERKALQIKAFIAILEVWGQTGDFSKAITGFASAKNLAQKADGAFYEGTDYVGEGQEVKVHNGKDGYRAALNTGEIVFNNKEADEARELGFGKRDSIMSLMRMASTGVSGGSVSVQVNDNSQLISVMQENNKLLSKLPSQMSTHNTGLTDDPRYIEEVVKKGNITNKAKRRANGTWA